MPVKKEKPPPPLWANLYEGFWEMYRRPTGKERRAYLLEKIREAGKLPVNAKHLPSTKDLDLQKLLKAGKIKQIREGLPHSRVTYLVPA